MLQWMGGSRRTINTSRQSTHKRQKQYFEQKKRQRQRLSHHQTHAHSDVTTDGATLRQNRSLDVLSLHNLAQQHRISETDHLKRHNSTVKDRFRDDPPATLKNSTAYEAFTQCMETGPFPRSQLDSIPIDKEVLTATQGKPLNDKMGNLWLGPAEHMSVLDLLGDDESNGDSESVPFNEDHVAFSLYGLGQVGTESPFCSPQHDSRKCSHDFPSLMKNLDNLDLLKDPDQHLRDFDAEVDSMIKGVDFFSVQNSFGFSTGTMESRNIPDWKELYCWDSMDLNCKDGGGTTSSGWRKFHHSFNNSGEDIWDSSPLPFSNQRSLEETDWYYTIEELSRQSRTLISSGSEESCSSSAGLPVKGQGTNSLSLNSNWRHCNGKQGLSCCSPGVGIGEARRCDRMPKPPRRTSMCSTAYPPEENILNNDWLVEKGYQSDHGNVNYNPFCRASNREKDGAAKQNERLSKIQQGVFRSFDSDYEVCKGKIGSQEPCDDINYRGSSGKAREIRNEERMGTAFCVEGKCRDEFTSADNNKNPDLFWR